MMIYTHVLILGGKGVRSPADALNLAEQGGLMQQNLLPKGFLRGLHNP